MFLNSIVENIPDMIFVKDAKDLRFLRWNQAGEKLVGYSKEAMIGKTDYDFFPKSEADFYTTKDREVLSGKTLLDIPEEVIQTKSQGTRYLHTKKIPILDEQGTPQYLLGISEDITEQKLAKLVHTQRELLLRLIFETGPGCIKRVAADGTLLHMNPSGLELIEAKEENEALGLSVFDLVVPEHVDAFRDMHQKVLEGEPQNLQFEVQGLKGTRRWMETYAVPFSNPLTNEVEHLAVTHDITERKTSEERAKQLSMQNELILSSAGDGIYGLNLQGQTTFVNPAGAKLLGFTPQELIGISMHTTIHHTKADGSPYPQKECPMYAAFTDGTIHKVENEVLWRKDGTSFPVEYSSMPIWQDGNLAGAVVTFQDISERKQAETTLRDTEQMYRQVLDSIPDMILVKDRNFRILWANKAFRSYYNMTNEELKGILDSSFNEPDFTKRYNEDDSYVFNTGKVLDIPEEPVTRHDGQVALFHTIKAPLYGESGEVVKSVGVSRDITERKQIEEIIRKGERKFRAIYEQAPTGIATVDSLSGQFTKINQKYCAITGYSQEEMLDLTFQEVTHPDDLQADMDHMQQLLTGQVTNFQMEKRYIRKNGKIIWVNLTCVPLWLKPTDPRQHIAMIEDITYRKLAVKALQESEERYRTLYEDNPSMYFTVAQDGEILSVNQFGAQQLGYSVEELIGHPVMGVFLEDDKPLAQEHFNACLQDSRRLYSWEIRKQRKDGSVLWVREVARTIQGGDGKTVVLIVCEDITERKQTEERLRQSEAKETEALRQSDELKSALLASVSHELRTPLTAMKGSVSSIIEKSPSSMDQESQEVLKGIDREINYMSHLVDNLLDMSQIEAGTLTPHKEWHLLEDLVEGALRRTAQTLDTRNIEISIPENVPPIFVDAVEMQQVFINLLDNAVKYSSPASPIRIHVRVEAQQIIVEASNMGEPLQPQDLERIFDRFYRRPPLRKQPIRGTGLGLAICKGIVEAHGGRIWADSIGGEVTITFTIPITESMPSFSLEGRHKSQLE